MWLYVNVVVCMSKTLRDICGHQWTSGQILAHFFVILEDNLGNKGEPTASTHSAPHFFVVQSSANIMLRYITYVKSCHVAHCRKI